MKLTLIAFSRRGAETGLRLLDELTRLGHSCTGFVKMRGAPPDGPLPPMTGALSDWTRAAFAEFDGILFVGACGIAVREIAPHLVSKASDPAVLAIDERGQYVIPLLSGHIGGANALARAIAPALGAQAIITTATDLSGVFAVDEWAAAHGLAIANLPAAKSVSAALLDGRPVGFSSEFPVLGPLPAGLTTADFGPLGLSISRSGAQPFSETLRLIPRVLTLGLGCRRGVPCETLEAAVLQTLAAHQLSPLAVRQIASIELKADEPGLLALSQRLGVPPVFYSADALSALTGDFSDSAFVRETTGVGCVCERSAVLAALPGALIVPKTAVGPVTVAVAQSDFTVSFER